MNAILAIAALFAAVTAREIVRAVAAHLKAKDALKALETIKKTAETRERGASYQLQAEKAKENTECYRNTRAELEEKKAELEKETAEIKTALADKIAAMTLEQLVAYNRTLDEANRPTVQYVPVPYMPYNYGLTQWRAW